MQVSAINANQAAINAVVLITVINVLPHNIFSAIQVFVNAIK
jgi:hypothetical protein